MTCLFLVFTTIAISGCTETSPEEHAAELVNVISEELNLTETQINHLEKIKQQLFALKEAEETQKNQAKKNIIALMEQPTFDRESSQKITNDYIGSLVQHVPTLAEAFGNFYDSLNATQRKELAMYVNKNLAIEQK